MTITEVCAAFPFSFPRKLGLRDGSPLELGVVAGRVETHQGRRVDVQYPLVLRERDGRIEAAFTDARPDDATQEQICIAIAERLSLVSDDLSIGAASPPFRSSWAIDKILHLFSGYQRVDDGTDTLAARVVSNSSNRRMYFYLYGEDPALIHFDLEDPDADTHEWDGAVGRGTVKNPANLLTVARTWLDTGGLASVDIKNGSQR